MAYTYDELKHKKVEELREIAKGLQHDAVRGYTQMNKEHLLPALCHALGIDTHAHHEVVALDKGGLKKRIRELKSERDAALAAHDHQRLKQIRRELHRCNRRIRAASV